MPPDLRKLRDWCATCAIAKEGNPTTCLQCLFETLADYELLKPKYYKSNGLRKH